MQSVKCSCDNCPEHFINVMEGDFPAGIPLNGVLCSVCKAEKPKIVEKVEDVKVEVKVESKPDTKFDKPIKKIFE